MKNYYVYILTNKNNNVLYIGIANNLIRRIFEHKNHLLKGFTDKYNCEKLVYFEETTDVNSAISREKTLKGWRRARKNELIESENPDWRDLAEEFL